MVSTSKKAGKTILISNEYQEDISFEGIDKIHKTENGSRFVIFDNVEHAKEALESLISNDVRVKYSYYKLFFRLRDMELQNMKYDELKETLKSSLSEQDVNTLYLKFYTKNGQLIGSGEITLDSKDVIDTLLNKRSLSLGDGSISFYKFRHQKKSIEAKV